MMTPGGWHRPAKRVVVWHSDRGVGFAVPPRLLRFLEKRFAPVRARTLPALKPRRSRSWIVLQIPNDGGKASSRATSSLDPDRCFPDALEANAQTP
jgi:hypothetical protein